MSRPRLLVVTTVHRPDDPRIRSKLIPSLLPEWQITYASKEPGPTHTHDFDWMPLRGSRVRRWAGASRVLLSRRWDLVAVHDPELLPAALARSWAGRPVLFDLHENLPEQVRTKARIPSWLRPVLAGLARRTLRIAERTMSVSLAEEGYGSLFKAPHPVLVNFLPESLPDPAPDAGYLVYLGDVTSQRGCIRAVHTAAGASLPLVLIGRVSPPEFRVELTTMAERLGVELEVAGEMPHEAALDRVARATAGMSPLDDVPNYRHSLPTKVLEYLALGVPVITSDLPGTTEVVGGCPGVMVVKSADAVAWFDAGKALAAQRAELRTSAYRNSEQIRQDFTWQAEEARAVYRSAGSGP